jgi:hypothetical protein
MAEDRIYLTVDSNPNGPGLIAVISQGSPQFGDEHVTVLDVELVRNMKAAKAWYRRRRIEQPWQPRS